VVGRRWALEIQLGISHPHLGFSPALSPYKPNRPQQRQRRCPSPSPRRSNSCPDGSPRTPDQLRVLLSSLHTHATRPKLTLALPCTLQMTFRALSRELGVHVLEAQRYASISCPSFPFVCRTRTSPLPPSVRSTAQDPRTLRVLPSRPHAHLPPLWRPSGESVQVGVVGGAGGRQDGRRQPQHGRL
jgi:hypothetical protein